MQEKFMMCNKATVLYHIISTYQLLCAIVHRLTFNPDKKAILIIPDFYTTKAPDIINIQNFFFDEAYLFPYLKIPHNRRTISHDTYNAWNNTVPYNLKYFESIYVGGAQFYFSDLLIKNKVRFSCFEEAAGIYSRPDVLKENIGKKYPVQKRWASKNKLLNLSNPLIDKVYCLMRAQNPCSNISKAVDFDVIEFMSLLQTNLTKKITDYFVKKRYAGKKNSVIVLTEQFANLGKMTEAQQRDLYLQMAADIPPELKVYVKPHPDDKMDYSDIFKGAIIIKEKFPSELLPFIFDERPAYITSVSSTGEEILKPYFTPILSEKYFKH